jgi:FkbM family methyltransferase
MTEPFESGARADGEASQPRAPADTPTAPTPPSPADERCIPLGAHNVLVRGRDGLFLANRNDVYVGRALIRYGEYSRAEADFLKDLCRPGDVVVEAGANVGSHTIGLARHVGPAGRVVAFEAQPEVFYALCANVALNSLHNVHCVSCALGAAPGALHLPPVDYDREGNFGGVSLDQGPAAAGTPVPVQPLDDLFHHERLRLFKVDVEGMEEAVLRGAARTIARHRPVLYVENDRVEQSRSLIELIKGWGYRLWWHLPPLFHPDNFFGVAENDYGNIASLNMLCLPREWTINIAGLREITDASEHPMRGQPAGPP